MFEEIIGSILKSIVALFVIMDPFSSLPTFLMLTKRQSPAQKRASALVATAVAGAALGLFVLVGPFLMTSLSISMPAFQIAGGILLLATALQAFLGLEFGKGDEKDIDVAVVVVGTPLLTGPGAMTTAVILASQFGLPVVFIAATVVMFLILLTLFLAEPMQKLIGKNGIDVSSKMASILLAAVAVQFMATGVQQVFLSWGLIH